MLEYSGRRSNLFLLAITEQGYEGKCIDDAQSAFMLGRLISDNVLLAYEILHMLKQKRLGRKAYIVIKLDLSKAYDRVEWNFIKEIMLRMGFDQKWVNALMKCVETVSYSVVINGHVEEKFLPKEDLKKAIR
ncbi:hypothetical protein PVK06_029735 [Gossypium arboreum]|uniref:Reverse transcriptase domain-containing protein n=1 Tax=Gossypium arboreum TaxID=29729 RepID=A0ABR0NLD4_GOSAR|nr:hypothetical protein PVK06_029735 [Gossypium arboreum]